MKAPSAAASIVAGARRWSPQNSAEAGYPNGMPNRHSTLGNLIRDANSTVACKPDSLDFLAQMIRRVVKDGAEPYILAGVLEKGAGSGLASFDLPERRPDTGLVEVLSERLRANGF
jgi:hypothetical protein